MSVLYSASTVDSYKNFGNTSYYLIHQVSYGLVLGLLGMYICWKLDYHVWKKLIPVIIPISLLFLILVKIPGLNFSSGGATRWIHIGPIFFQPSEIAKLSVIFYIASWINQRQKHLHNFAYGLLPSLVLTGLYAALILWQPDLGTMIAMTATAFVMFFAGGVNLKYLGTIFFSGVAALLVLIKLEPYRLQRLTTFLDPSFDKLGIGYQINQALLAIGSGRWFGYGYGLSRQKYNYLPEAIGDSVFAVLAEELGFMRVIIVLIIFILFALRGLQIAYNAPDFFGKLLGVGIISGILIQVIINIASIIGLLPLTGIPLPFFSYGSSALIILLCEIGILLNIAKQSKGA